MAEMVKCPLCGKEIGKQVLDGVHGLANLGTVQMVHDDLDYRKASHIFWNAGRLKKSGILCKKCARSKFPDGKAYYVVVDYHGKWMSVEGGNVCGPYYDTRTAADRRCIKMNMEHGGGYTVFEKAI